MKIYSVFNAKEDGRENVMNEFTIFQNSYLNQDIRAFYHAEYTRMGNPGNPDYLNELKNTFGDFSDYKLNNAVDELKDVLIEDLGEVLSALNSPFLTVCVVPRAKAENTYNNNQLLFKSNVKSLINDFDNLINGADYIIRHTDTKTTHLIHTDYAGDGEMPYPGITIDTCNFSEEITGENILLVDDIYTRNINIDEDVIQALLEKGANSVIFYAVARTI